MAGGRGEVIEAEAEGGDEPMHLPANPQSANLSLDRFESMMKLAENAEKVAAALDKVRKLVLNRALPGDFVIHGEKVNCGAAGAERMRTLVGLSFVNWREPKKIEWEDKNGKAYAWWYAADVALNGQVVMEFVENRASSRDKFFGYEDGKWKELGDVKETDIRMSAHRGVIKEGTLGFLGLRALPNDPETLKSLGLDPTKIKRVERGQRGEKKVDAAAPGTPVTLKEVNPFSAPDKIENGKVIRKAYVRYDVIDTEGRKASTFDKKVAEFAQKMIGKKVLMPTKATAKGVDIVEIVPYTEPATDQEPNT